MKKKFAEMFLEFPGIKVTLQFHFFVLNGCIDAVIKLVQLFGPPETVWRTGKANIHWAHSYM